MLAITMKTDPAQGKSNMFHCPIFCLVFPRSRQKPFVRRSSLQAHSLLLLLLSLSGWWCVKCALSFLALILKNLACKDFTCLATVSLHMHDEITVPWQGFLFLIYIARQIYTLLKTLFLFHISCLHGRFFGKMKFTPKMPISFLLILQNCQLIMIMWFQYYFHHIIIVMLTICHMFPYVLVSLRSVYIVIVPYIDPLWPS